MNDTDILHDILGRIESLKMRVGRLENDVSDLIESVHCDNGVEIVLLQNDIDRILNKIGEGTKYNNE